MTILATQSEEPDEAVDTIEMAVVVQATAATVLISEQQVLFATSAAGLDAPRRRRRWSVLHAWLTSTPRTPRRRHHPSRRAAYMEHAAMSREMHRL